MASRDESTLPTTRPKSRKSLAHIPSAKNLEQENMTADLGALASGKRAVPIEKPSKKSRSKSIGPGGLDALKDTSGNSRKVWFYLSVSNQVFANNFQVFGCSPSSSSKIDPEANNATTSRDSGACFHPQGQSQESYPAIRAKDRKLD
jgi:hypothetical protein